MRLTTLAIVTATLFVAASAGAAEGGKGAGDTGKGGAGPASAGGGPSGETGSSSGIDNGDRIDPDRANGLGSAYKPWEVGAIFTTHRLIYQGDLAAGQADPTSEPGAGSAINKQVNDYEFYGRYDITKHDRVGVRAYVFEYFLADQGETGVRFDDMVFTYAHTFDLPKKFRLQTSLWVTAPTSYTSQLEGLITTFRPILNVDRRFGPVSIDAKVYDTIYVERYSSYAGSGGLAPTNLNTVAMALDVEFHMPFHEPLSLGVGAFNAYNWYYNINSGVGPGQTSGNSTKDSAGGVVDSGSQPIQQTYGWEAYLRYLMPDLVGFKSDLTLAYSFGDPTVGYSSVLQDGVGHVFLGYRHNSEVYLSLGVRY
jgi:hypothetical protein